MRICERHILKLSLSLSPFFISSFPSTYFYYDFMQTFSFFFLLVSYFEYLSLQGTRPKK
jgi:hypothetical protein